MVRSSGGKVENPNSWAICRTTDLQPQQAEPRRARRRVRGKALPYVYGILQAAVLGHGKPGVVAGAAVAGIGLDGSGEGKARTASAAALIGGHQGLTESGLPPTWPRPKLADKGDGPAVCGLPRGQPTATPIKLGQPQA